MARDGYLILDSDLHMMEPDDLWARYLEGPHRASPPRFFGGQQRTLSESSEDKGNADTIMGMEVQGQGTAQLQLSNQSPTICQLGMSSIRALQSDAVLQIIVSAR